MIQIYSSSIEDSGHTPNIVDEIKELRSFLHARYGNSGGLRECKECIESILRIQRVARTPIKVKRSDLQGLKDLAYKISGITIIPSQRIVLEDMINMLDRMMLNNEL